MKDQHKILIISISGMGTTILFIPLLKFIRKKFPKSEISILVSSDATKALLQNNPTLDRIYVWDFVGRSKTENIWYLLNLRKEKFDISINVYPNIRKEHNIVAYLAGAKTRVSHKAKGSGRLSSLVNKKIPADLDIHDTENNKRLLGSLGIKTDEPLERPSIFLEKDEIKEAEQFLSKHNIGRDEFVLAARVGETEASLGRNWPPERYGELVTRISEQGGKVIGLSSPDERKIVEKVDRLSGDNLIIYEDKNIRNVAAVISLSSCYLGDDSGLMHVASCVGTPIVALFGPTNKNWTGPIADKLSIVEYGIDCSPCLDRLNPPKGGDKSKFNLIECYIEDKFACMKYLELNKVLDAIEKVSRVPLRN